MRKDNVVNKEKFSNIELLRIVAMLMIVAHHYYYHGLFNFWHTNSTTICHINNILAAIFSMGGKLGVDIFVLITGYFMISSKFKFTHVVKLYLRTLAYTLIFLFIAYLYGEHHIPSKIISRSLFPIGGNAYWFITTYIMLYLFSPYLNKFILTSKKNMLNSFMVITTCLWVIVPTFTSANYGFSSLAWFIYMYFVGACIRLKTFASLFNNKKIFKILFFISSAFLTFFACIKCTGSEVNLHRVTKIAGMQTLFIVSIALYLFHYFKDLQISYNKFINYISASVFGVYLFHENPIVRPFLWQVIVKPWEVMDKSYMIIYFLTVTLIIFLVGIFIDKLIGLTFGKLIDNIITKLQNIDLKKRKILYKNLIKIVHKINKQYTQ